MKLKELADRDKARYCREVQIYNESYPDDRIVPRLVMKYAYFCSRRFCETFLTMLFIAYIRINPPDGREVRSQDRFHSAYNHYMHQVYVNFKIVCLQNCQTHSLIISLLQFAVGEGVPLKTNTFQRKKVETW